MLFIPTISFSFLIFFTNASYIEDFCIFLCMLKLLCYRLSYRLISAIYSNEGNLFILWRCVIHRRNKMYCSSIRTYFCYSIYTNGNSKWRVLVTEYTGYIHSVAASLEMRAKAGWPPVSERKSKKRVEYRNLEKPTCWT